VCGRWHPGNSAFAFDVPPAPEFGPDIGNLRQARIWVLSIFSFFSSVQRGAIGGGFIP